MTGLVPRFPYEPIPPIEPVADLAAHAKEVQAIVFVGPGRFVSAGEDGRLALWDVEGALLREFDGHGGWAINCACPLADGGFVTGGDDQVVRLWDPGRTTCRAALEGHAGFVRSVAARGGRLASAAEDRAVLVRDLADLARVVRSDLPEEPTAVAVSPDGRTVAVASLDNAIRLVDAATGAALESLYASDSPIASVGRVYLAIDNDSGRGHRQPPRRLLWLDDGGLVSAESEILVWDVIARTERLAVRMAWSVEALAATRDGLVVASRDVFLVDARGGVSAWLPAPGGDARALAVSPGRRWVAIGGKDGRIVVHAVDAFSSDFARHREAPVDLRVSPDGRLALTTDSDNARIVWSTSTGRAVGRVDESCPNAHPAVFVGHDSIVTSRPEPTRSFTHRSTDGAVLRHVDLEGDPDRIRPHAFGPSPDGTVLLGSMRGPLSRWDLGPGTCERFEGRTAQVNEIRLSPDGATAVTEAYFPTIEPEPGTFSIGDSVPQLQAWDLRARTLLWTVAAGRPDPKPGQPFTLSWGFGAVEVCPDGVLCGSGDGADAATLRDYRSGEVRWRFPLPGVLVAWWVEGGRAWALTVGREGGRPVLHETRPGPGRLVRSLDLEGSSIRTSAMLGGMVVLLDADDLRVFDRDTGRQLQRIEGLSIRSLRAAGGVLVATMGDGRIAAFEPAG